MCEQRKEITIETILENNRNWVGEKVGENPAFFTNLAKEQKPPFLWIGCSDSRIPANEVTGTQPGEVFVHRNIANLVVNNDLNVLSVLDYAINVLHIKHIIVCGHYGCGGIKAAYRNKSRGIIDNWLRNIKDVYRLHKKEIDTIEDEPARLKRLVEINVCEQINNLSQTAIIKDAWDRGMDVQLYGLVYDIETGFLRNQECLMSGQKGYYNHYNHKFGVS